MKIHKILPNKENGRIKSFKRMREGLRRSGRKEILGSSDTLNFTLLPIPPLSPFHDEANPSFLQPETSFCPRASIIGKNQAYFRPGGERKKSQKMGILVPGEGEEEKEEEEKEVVHQAALNGRLSNLAYPSKANRQCREEYHSAIRHNISWACGQGETEGHVVKRLGILRNVWQMPCLPWPLVGQGN